jgi:hypothetical protein
MPLPTKIVTQVLQPIDIATVYQARPKANPGTRTNTHERVRTDRVDEAGSVTLRKELLLLRTEVGGIQLNWDGSEVFHLVIRNSWVERIRLCHSHNTQHDGLVARRIRFRRSLIRRRRQCRVTRRPVPASRCTPRGRTGADDDFLDRRQRIAVGSNEFQTHYRGAVAAVVKPTFC